MSMRTAIRFLVLVLGTTAMAAPGPYVCGNGIIENLEQCDDGEYNGTLNSCCTRGCSFTGESPDLIVSRVLGVVRFGSASGITAYAAATEACNLGSCWLRWYQSTPEHPVIAQNLFRLKDGRLEQIGQAWLKHGFGAAADSTCGICVPPPNFDHLGVNCSDPYAASTNGQQNVMGPKSDVDPFTGSFPFPDARIAGTGNVIFKRLQVHNTDLDPALNAGARYFYEVQYVTPDDPGALHGNDNVSYREALVSPSPYNLSISGTTERRMAGVRAWKANEPAVTETDVDAQGLLIVAAKATALGGGLWRYEYAVQNVTSYRSAGSFSVPLPPGAAVTNLGFHDVDYHSGEPFDGTDWVAAVSPAAVTWSTSTYDANPNANALRWGTLYNFRFDANVPPGTSAAAIGLFRPGTPGSVSARTITPEPCTGAVEGLPCDDGDACTRSDACASGVCSGGTPVVCTASDPCRDPGTCDPASGLCSEVPKPEGGACDDGNSCTAADVCTASECRGAAVAGPAEVDDGVWLAQGGGVTTIGWNAAAGSTSSGVLRGSIGGLPVGPGGGDETCLAGAVTGTSATDPEVPLAGDGYWYLVRGESVCGEGPYGAGRTSATCP